MKTNLRKNVFLLRTFANGRAFVAIVRIAKHQVEERQLLFINVFLSMGHAPMR